MCYEIPFTHRNTSDDKTRKSDLPVSGKVESPMTPATSGRPAATMPGKPGEARQRHESEDELVPA